MHQPFQVHKSDKYQPSPISHSWVCDCGQKGIPVHDAEFNDALAVEHVEHPGKSVTTQYLELKGSY